MGGGENLATIDSYYLPPRRRPERTGPSYHNKVLTVAIQDGEGLVWRLPLPVPQVERQARADERSTTSGCVARQRRYSSMNSSESGCPLSSSMACASDMEAGTSSFKRVLGLYQCIICIGPPFSTSVQAPSSY